MERSLLDPKAMKSPLLLAGWLPLVLVVGCSGQSNNGEKGGAAGEAGLDNQEQEIAGSSGTGGGNPQAGTTNSGGGEGDPCTTIGVMCGGSPSIGGSGQGGSSGGAGGSYNIGGEWAAWGGADAAGGTNAEGGATGSVCDGYTPPVGDTCRSTEDCPFGGQYCLAPGESDPNGCGVCTSLPQACVSDGDCSTGAVCIEHYDPCACEASGIWTTCELACTADSCADGEQCSANGHCEPIACDEGYECAPNTRCDPTSAVAHGCTILSCQTDGDCDCGACVNGSCASGPGLCSFPAA